MAYVKPVRPAFVVASDKVEQFRAQKPDPAAKERQKKLAELFKKNNLKK